MPPHATLSLFLHGGPGLSCIAERDAYSDTLPVHWWDQPRAVVHTPRPFATLVDAALDQLDELRRANGDPVPVVAHSFGANLAYELALRRPDAIASLTLLAPVHDLGGAFVQLAARLAAANATQSERLRDAILTYKNGAPGINAIWALIVAVQSTPDFLSAYWSKAARAAHKRFVELMACEPVFDPAAYEAIFKDFATSPAASSTSACSAPVHIVFGTVDPLARPEHDFAWWRGRFTNAVRHDVDAGHFIQLETPPSTWLGEFLQYPAARS